MGAEFSTKEQFQYEDFDRCPVCGAHLIEGRYAPLEIATFGAGTFYLRGQSHVCSGSTGYCPQEVIHGS